MFAVNKEEFLANEKASKDTIDVKRIYIDMAGDLVSGILLSQIVFWHLPSDKGGSKLRVYHKGEYWIARGREDYWEDCRLTAKQFDRAIKELEELNLVITDVLKFNGSPMKHVRIDWEVFLASYQNLLKSYGENGYSPKGKNQVPKKAISLTESTSETTKESGANPAPALPKEKSPAELQADADFDAMPSQSAGMVPQKHTAATADPRVAERQFVKEIAPVCAQIMGREKPISEDTRTAKKIFRKHLPLAGVLARLDAYRNGEGAEFRKPEAIADWIVGRLERELVPRNVGLCNVPRGENLGVT